MSQIAEVKYGRRFKIAEYEWEEYQLTATAEDGETGTEVLLALKAEVNKAFTGEVSAPEAQEETKAEAPAKKAKKEKKEKKNAKSDVADDEDEHAEDSEGEDAGADAQGSEDDEATDVDGEDDGDGESEEADEAEDEEAVEEKPAPKAAKKAFRKKPQTYDRGIEAHKEIFARVLKSVAPDWSKSDAGKKKAKGISADMEGAPFLDDNGDVYDAFKEKLKKSWAKK